MQPKPLFTLIAAGLLTLFYLAVSWYLLDTLALQADDKVWAHVVTIYNGISSVGYSAIGVLLGTAVQQINVAAARRDVAEAREDSAKKAGAIRQAVDTLGGANAPHPAAVSDVGGGEPTRRIELAHTILLQALR